MSFNSILDANVVLACDTNNVQSNTPYYNFNISNIKRPREADSLSPVNSPKKAKPSKKASRQGADKPSINEKTDDKPRVGCPFYKKDGILKQASCNGKGWPDPGKMKDHLKSVHKLDLKWLNQKMHFKEKPYFGKPIDVQWRLAFLELFPEVPKDQVPSPYINDVNAPPRTTVATEDLNALGVILKHKLLEHYKFERQYKLLVTDIGTAFDHLFAGSVAHWKGGAPVPPQNAIDYDMTDLSQSEYDSQTAFEMSIESSFSPNLEDIKFNTFDAFPIGTPLKTEDIDDAFAISSGNHGASAYIQPDEDLDAKPDVNSMLMLAPAEDTIDEDVKPVINPSTPTALDSEQTSLLETPVIPDPTLLAPEDSLLDSFFLDSISYASQSTPEEVVPGAHFDAAYENLWDTYDTNLWPFTQTASPIWPSFGENVLDYNEGTFNNFLMPDTNDMGNN